MNGIGIHPDVLSRFNKELSLKRIYRDIKSDFIFAPHYNDIYSKVDNELYEILLSQLKSGTYNPKLPITINVIKQNEFNRIGSILEPIDRLAYQLVVDYIAPQAEHEINREQVFSNQLLENDTDGSMFKNSRQCYKDFQRKIELLCKNDDYKYVLKADIASYFDRIYQHVLINLLNSSGANSNAVNFLEKFLLRLTQKDSHGIIQGVFPSDFLGNFNLCSIDAQHSLQGLEFARYIDDMYIFFPELNEARIHKNKLSNWLRNDGLTLNEAKTKIIEKEVLLKEETEIDKLFDKAWDEIYSEKEDEVNEKKEEQRQSFSFYGDITSWDINRNIEDFEIDEEEVELRALENLYDYETERYIRLKIEKFCLPAFSNYKSEYAIDNVLESFSEEPSMSQIYFSYLVSIIRSNESLVKNVEKIFEKENLIFEYQKLWLYSILLFANSISDSTIKRATTDLQNPMNNQSIRAICSILIGKNGNASYRRILKNHYFNEQSEYVRSSILYASQYFPCKEKDTCFTAWGGHNIINSLIVKSLKKL